MAEKELIYKDLSYQINGILFSVHNELGRYANEKQVCDYIEEKLKQNQLVYEREKNLKPSFPGEQLGRNRVDFIIQDLIILEIKTKNRIERCDYGQTIRYLESTDKKLGLLVNFKDNYLKIRRILNPHSNEVTNSHISKFAPLVNPCLKIKIKRLNPNAKLPQYAHPGDVGMDLFSLEDYTLQPNERHIFFTGFALEFPTGYAAIVKDKSSTAVAGLHTNGGVFDAGYRGEYNVQLTNLSETPFEIKQGQKIAQLIIFPVAIGELIEVDELSDSERGEGRMGSTGKF